MVNLKPRNIFIHLFVAGLALKLLLYMTENFSGE